MTGGTPYTPPVERTLKHVRHCGICHWVLPAYVILVVLIGVILAVKYW